MTRRNPSGRSTGRGASTWTSNAGRHEIDSWAIGGRPGWPDGSTNGQAAHIVGDRLLQVGAGQHAAQATEWFGAESASDPQREHHVTTSGRVRLGSGRLRP